MKTKIYALCSPDGDIRYIGKTIGKLSERFLHHLSSARSSKHSHKDNWIRLLLKAGKLPSINLIGEIEGDGCKEEIAWIKYFKDEGVDLTNTTLGGDMGMTGRTQSEEMKKRISQKLQGRKLSPEHCKKISDALMGRRLSMAHRIATSIGKKGKKFSMERCNALSIAQKKRYLDPLAREKTSRAMMGHRGWSKGKKPSLATRKKLSIALMGHSVSIETRKKTAETWRKKREQSRLETLG